MNEGLCGPFGALRALPGPRERVGDGVDFDEFCRVEELEKKNSSKKEPQQIEETIGLADLKIENGNGSLQQFQERLECLLFETEEWLALRCFYGEQKGRIPSCFKKVALFRGSYRPHKER